ncbi:heme-binding protein [Pseudomonas sp. S37]|uniref:GlcG/HbpS family heme-binding protein n=1 Tax=Pseudomonas sp. S37 TaxID=2767449 RepID=UPI0019125E28|nr:heme-binding protein [Pseudomonas sp. S37]MBK4997298.1 heme-binding protein [Pseudomonas sp. S37]
MQTRYALDLDVVSVILQQAIDHASAQGWAVSIAVVDEGGGLLAFARMDGASLLSAELAQGKARTAAIGKRDSMAFEAMVQEGRLSLLSVQGLTCLEGGLPLRYEGQCLGAIGVSGVASHQDTQIARAGAAVIG